ncbi:hypothetical protein BGZ70_001452 [Mortierella alpina]|uniref:Uncharacterized protein n=1 Tax=Mortierella alpina TaxID=64518 RepID=A0A9P6IVX5_MORAP|nr:hypothetical protein BGZ70_001452 [Mortierella alpina]
MDTPMRKIGEMALNSPVPGSKASRGIASANTPIRKTGGAPLASASSGSKPARDIEATDIPISKAGGMSLKSPLSGLNSIEKEARLNEQQEKEARLKEQKEKGARLKEQQEKEARLKEQQEQQTRIKEQQEKEARLKERQEKEIRSKELASPAYDDDAAHDHGLAPDHEHAHMLEADSCSSQISLSIEAQEMIASTPPDQELSHYLDPDSLSSQNPLMIQPGQIIESTPPEQYLPMDSNAHNDSPLFLDPFSTSSQNPFMMQPGQVIESTPPEPYFSTRPNARTKSTGKERSRPRNNHPANMEQASPQALIISDDSLDDLDDFLDLPEPASMLNRSFRTKAKATKDDGAAAKKSKSPKKAPSRAGKGTGRKGTIALDDSEDDGRIGGEANVTKPARGASTAKPCILDRMLPLSARQRRQSLLKRRAARSPDHTAGNEADIEIGRHVTEKLWNATDDLFDSEGLDRRQVKGVGLGGVVGGIGAVSGSLAVSNITKSAMEATRAKEGSEMPLRRDWGANDEHREDVFAFSQPSYELEDPNYGLSSQDWWTGVQPNHEGGRSGDTQSKADDGLDAEYLSPLEDFVDLRKRRDDPTVAMYFAQLDAMGAGGTENGSGSKTTRGRKRGGARGRGSKRGGKGVSYAAGVGPMPTTMGASSSTGAGSAQRDGSSAGTAMSQSTLPFGGQATTANGSLAIRSKPTPAFTPGGPSRGRGGANKSTWKRNPWAWRGRGRGGRGGRGRGAPY